MLKVIRTFESYLHRYYDLHCSESLSSEVVLDSVDGSETRRSRRVVKKPKTELYVHGEEEVDNVSIW